MLFRCDRMWGVPIVIWLQSSAHRCGGQSRPVRKDRRGTALLADPRPSVVPTLGMVSRTHDWLETNPDVVEEPPTRVARDWALFALIVGASAAQVVFVDHMTWRWLGVPVGLILAFATLWR